MTPSPQAHRRNLLSLMIFAMPVALLIGCEGADRKHDRRIADVNPPPAYAEPLPGDKPVPEKYNYPDLVEDMMNKRQTYVDSIMTLERAYLNGGDSDRANWARTQRAQVMKVENYPYLSKAATEYTRDAAPEQSIPEADKLYAKGLSILNTFRRVPLAGALESNKKKAREALTLFKQVLADYPKSDKVDDAAFWCGEIYKEYLREEDPNDELSVRYYQWACALDATTPHPARFQCAVVYDFRKHDRARAIELYHEVLDKETRNNSNVRFSATRIEQLTDEEHSHVRPRDKDVRDTGGEPPPSEIDETAPARQSQPEPAEHADAARSPSTPRSASDSRTVTTTVPPDDDDTRIEFHP